MSQRSARQRKYLSDARAIVTARMQFALGFDAEDAATLIELETAKEVASAMFLGGEFGVVAGTSLESFIANHRDSDARLKEKDRRIDELQAELSDLRHQLAQAKGRSR